MLTTAIKAMNGGLFVVLFALAGEAAKPKRFAGLFSAAPSIALANLAVIAIANGPDDAQRQSTGMVIGAGALVAACAIGIVAVARWRALRGALAVCGAWLVLAAAGGWLVLG
jgi:hypothetical protein